LKKCLTKSKSAVKKIKAENYFMEEVFLKKSPSFTNKLSRAKRNFSATYDDIKSPDGIRCFDGTVPGGTGTVPGHSEDDIGRQGTHTDLYPWYRYPGL
jgi:hypothetical protein